MMPRWSSWWTLPLRGGGELLFMDPHSSVQLPGHWDWSSYITAPLSDFSAFGEAMQSLTPVGPILPQLSPPETTHPPPATSSSCSTSDLPLPLLCSILRWALVKHHSLNPLIMISSLMVAWKTYIQHTSECVWESVSRGWPEEEGPTPNGMERSHALGSWSEKIEVKEESEVNPSIDLSPPPHCRHSVTSCLEPLLPHTARATSATTPSHLDELYSQTMRQLTLPSPSSFVGYWA